MTRLLAACIAALAILVAPAGAETFPNRVIRIMVPFTPGGSNDIVAREIANGLQARFNQTAVVENKPGGGGVIAYNYVAKVAGRRLPDADHAGLVHDGAAPVEDPALQPGHRIRPDHPGRRRAVRHGGAADRCR